MTTVVQKKIMDQVTMQGATITARNKNEISGITCGGDINFGNINQQITIVQNFQQAANITDRTEFALMVDSAVTGAQDAASKMTQTPDFEPFFGKKDETFLINTTQQVINEIKTDINIQDISNIYQQQIADVNAINDNKINNIICGGNFKVGDIDQGIQALQVASAVSEKITELIFNSKTVQKTVQDAKAEGIVENRGIGGVFKDLGEGLSKVIGSIGNVIGKVGGIYAAIIAAVVIAVVVVIVVVIMNIGSIGGAVSGVMETAGKTGFVPGKFAKMGKRLGPVSSPVSTLSLPSPSAPSL
jgi:hypothetical protein